MNETETLVFLTFCSIVLWSMTWFLQPEKDEHNEHNHSIDYAYFPYLTDRDTVSHRLHQLRHVHELEELGFV